MTLSNMKQSHGYLTAASPFTAPIRTVTLMLCLFSVASLGANWFVYNFPGNNYIFHSSVTNCIWLFFSFLILSYKLDVKTISREDAKEYFIYIIIILLVAFGLNAIQYTPYAPIDRYIIKLEQYLHLDTLACIGWLRRHEALTDSFDFIYRLIGLELFALPIVAIFFKKYYYLYEYYFLLLITTLLGFIFYYFFPTTGPASIFHLSLFSEEQIATGLKFQELHHYQPPSTVAGGMIAMPSYHVIWAYLIAYFTRFNPYVCVIVTSINLLIIASCVLLGWHYILDVIGSLFTVLIALWIKNRCRISPTVHNYE